MKGEREGRIKRDKKENEGKKAMIKCICVYMKDIMEKEEC